MRVAVIAAALLTLAAPSRAALYAFENPVFPVMDPRWHSGDPATYFGETANEFMHKLTIRIGADAIQRGSFTYHYSNYGFGFPPVLTGDVADFGGFTFAEYALSPSDRPRYEELTASLTFDGDGVVTSGSLFWMTDDTELKLSGDANHFGGEFILGANSACNSECQVQGQLLDPPDPAAVNTPEPGTAALLAPLLAGLVWRRRRGALVIG
jgi:hypothetical protein